MTTKKIQTLLMTTLLMLVVVLTSCSKSDDDKGGGGLTPDPNVPTLSDIKYELSPTAVIVPEATAKKITAIDVTGHKFTLPSDASKPEVGQTLIINTPSEILHDGLLAKVKSVTESASGYIVTYSDAELKDAFKTIDIPEQYIPLGEYVEHVYDADGKEIKYQTRSNTRASGTKSFEIILPEIGWKIDEGIELTPKMSIDLLLRYVFLFGDYELSYCGAKIDADISVGADMTAELKASKLLDKKFHILTLVCGAIPIGPVLLTPSIDVQGVVTIEGKVVLEASISYERTLHTSMIYQKGAGMTGDCYLDPEADDALKYSFGPKFEGGIAYGLAMGGNIGIFGKTLAVRSRINVMKKETMSGKLNIAEFEGGLNDWLTPYDFALDPYLGLKDKKIILDYASKWNFFKFEDIMYNQAIGIRVGWDLTTIGFDVASTNLPEMSIPISSVHIMPQTKIDEKDFFNFSDNDVTLTLHHTEKSVLDDLAEFRVEFKPVTDNKDAEVISKHFDFDDEKRNLLVAEIKDADVTSTAKATLNGEDDYDITVYMDILGVEIPIFDAKAKKNIEFRTDVNGVRFEVSDLIAFASDGSTHDMSIKEVTWGEEMITITPIGNTGSFKCVATRQEVSWGMPIESSISFTVGAPEGSKYGLVKDIDFTYKVTGTWNADGQSQVVNTIKIQITDVPNSEIDDSKYGYAVYWEGSPEEKTASIVKSEYSSVITKKNGDVISETYSGFDAKKNPKVELRLSYPVKK